MLAGVSDLRLSLGVDSRTILAEWTRPVVVGTSLEGYRVTSEIVGVGDCDDEDRGMSSSVVVDDAITTQLISDVVPWRRYRITVSCLYNVGHADAFAEISSRETGQLLCMYTVLFEMWYTESPRCN